MLERRLDLCTAPPPLDAVLMGLRASMRRVRKHNRVTTAFRVVLVIPIAIVIGVLTAGATRTVYYPNGNIASTTSGGIATGLFLATLLMILFRQRYPRWWFDFVLELARFSTRVGAYLGLLTDDYPSTVDSKRCISSSTTPTWSAT